MDDMDAIEDLMAAALTYFDGLLMDDKAAQECANGMTASDKRPCVVKLLDSLPSHVVRIELVAADF